MDFGSLQPYAWKKDRIINGFKSAGVTEAIQSAQEIVAKAENPFCEYSVSGML